MCVCLDNIIKNDTNRYNIEEERFEIKTILETLDVGIVFETKTEYRCKKIDLENNHIIFDKKKEDCSTIPFLFCPICGEKSNIDCNDFPFYEKLQKKKKKK